MSLSLNGITKWCGSRIREYDTLTSTNDEALIWAEEGADHGSLVISEEQTAGHGRGDRIWHSPPGDNIYMTLILRPDFPAPKASMITLLMGLAVSRGTDRLIRESVREPLAETRIKWPNDVLLNSRKMCGILTGMRTEPSGDYFAYVGVGINVNGTDYPEELKRKAVSIRGALLDLGCKRGDFLKGDRDRLTGYVLAEFEGLYEEFRKEQNLLFIKSEYNKRLINLDETIRVLDPRGAYEGICCGISAGGELIVETGEGIRLVMSGEVQVRALDGSYV